MNPSETASNRRSRRALAILALGASLALVAACSSSDDGDSASTSTSTVAALEGSAAAIPADAPQAVTPILARVPDAPVPFPGSDGMTHVVYELFITNATGGDATLDEVEILDQESGETVATLDAETIAENLSPIPAGEDMLTSGQSATLYIQIAFPDADAVPASLTHTLSANVGGELLEGDVASVEVSDHDVLDLAPPMKGGRYVAADGCCDSTRHRQALLPINGKFSIAQRYAIDWEKLDGEDRIYAGDASDLESYAIYGEEALAMGAGTVVRVIDGLPEQVPGTYPEDIDVEDADGNAVIIDLGGGNFILYAHLQPGSIAVSEGDEVAAGDLLGLVGNSGNSLAPHLHLHVMNSPLSLAGEGLPYTIDSFSVSGVSNTDAFDLAEADGTPLEFDAIDPATDHAAQYPMDQSIVTFAD